MALPTYWVNLILHESSHALVAKTFGAKIIKFELLPGRHGKNGRFYFGYVQYRGRLSKNEKTLFFIAPKIVDLIGLGGYAALLANDALPDNHYGHLALTVLATGFLVDFAKEIFVFWGGTDVDKAFARNHLDSFAERLPWRLLHIGVAAAASYVVLSGYDELFESDTSSAAAGAVIAPLFSGQF